MNILEFVVITESVTVHCVRRGKELRAGRELTQIRVANAQTMCAQPAMMDAQRGEAAMDVTQNS